MESLINTFLEWKASYAPRASKNYELPLRRFFELVKKKPDKITTQDIAYFSRLMQDRYSPAYSSYQLIVLKNFFEFVRRQGIQAPDPYFVKIPRYETKGRIHITQEEFEQIDSLLAETEFFELQKKLIVRLLFETGVRISELCSLDIRSIDTNARKILITTKKNYQKRWIKWGEETHRLLIKYMGVRICLNQQPALFIASERGGRRDRLSIRTAQRWIKEVCKKAGIAKAISPHSFRHGKAHRMLELGANVKHIQSILGHSELNPAASFQYIKLSEREFDEVADKFLGPVEKSV